MNILYLHGFRSSGNSDTANYIQDKLGTRHTVFCFDLPHQPKKAIELITEKIKELEIDIIIGTSLGGVYAYNFEMPKICVNPGFQFTIQPGDYTYFKGRENGETEFTITQEDIKYLEGLVESYKTRESADELFYLSYILIGEDDDQVKFDKINHYINMYDELVYAKFGHRLTNEIIDRYIIHYIRQLFKSIQAIKNNPFS